MSTYTIKDIIEFSESNMMSDELKHFVRLYITSGFVEMDPNFLAFVRASGLSAYTNMSQWVAGSRYIPLVEEGDIRFPLFYQELESFLVKRAAMIYPVVAGVIEERDSDMYQLVSNIEGRAMVVESLEEGVREYSEYTQTPAMPLVAVCVTVVKVLSEIHKRAPVFIKPSIIRGPVYIPHILKLIHTPGNLNISRNLYCKVHRDTCGVSVSTARAYANLSPGVMLINFMCCKISPGMMNLERHVLMRYEETTVGIQADFNYIRWYEYYVRRRIRVESMRINVFQIINDFSYSFSVYMRRLRNDYIERLANIGIEYNGYRADLIEDDDDDSSYEESSDYEDDDSVDYNYPSAQTDGLM